MRERLTLAFVGLALVIIVVAGAVRAMTLGDIVHASETDDLELQSLVVGRVVDGLEQSDRPVDAASLSDIVAPHVRLIVERPGEDDVVVDGSGFDAAAQDVSASSTVGDATVTLVQDETVTAAVLDSARGPLVALMVGLVALAAVLGQVADASTSSRPAPGSPRSTRPRGCGSGAARCRSGRDRGRRPTRRGRGRDATGRRPWPGRGRPPGRAVPP